MNFRIPLTHSPIEKLKKKSVRFRIFRRKQNSKLTEQLANIEVPLTREEYLGIVVRSALFVFIACFIFATTLLFLISANNSLIYGLIISLLSTGFSVMSQMIYPKVYLNRKEKAIERNLVPALQDILVQLNSGIPLFNILVNISSANYNELSLEFKKAVRKINAGIPETDVLDEMGKKNTSVYFRRALWQISNGMKAGSDIAVVIKDNIKSLNEEQLIQIQTYGNKLNPLIMFYMLISVILPALSVTFLTVISSLINLSKSITLVAFIGMFVLVVIMQVSFIGMIKSIRPSLI